MMVGGQAQLRLVGSTSALARCGKSPDVTRDGWRCKEGPTLNERIQTDLPTAGHQRGH
jgi:hypothetical protein